MLPTELSGALRDLNVDEAAITALLTSLEAAGQDLDAAGFKVQASIPSGSFGGSSTGHELAEHHRLAHAVVTETIQGVIADLLAFHDNVKQTVRVIDETDRDSADQLSKERAAVESMSRTVQDSRTDQARQDAQRNVMGTETVEVAP